MMRLYPKRILSLVSFTFITVFILYVMMAEDTCLKIRDPNEDHQNHAQGKDSPQLRPNPGPFEADTINVDDLLVANFVPNTVFYVFCVDIQLYFHQYISILSVIRHLRPDAIVFFYDYEPQNYPPFYYTFYDELKEYPYFRTMKVNTTVACENNHKPKLDFIYSLLQKWGGWYFHETTMITWYTASMRNKTIIDGLDHETHRGFLMAQRGLPLQKKGLDALKKKYYHQNIRCTDNHTYRNAPLEAKPFCLNLESPFFPEDFMTLDNDFGKVSRLVFYQNPEIPVPKPGPLFTKR